MGINLRQLIYDFGCNNSTKENYITDGKYKCNFEALYKIVEQLSGYYKNDLVFKSVTTFCFKNTVPDVIFLIWLLVEEKSFILVSADNIDFFRQNKILFYSHEISIAYDNINSDLSFSTSFININKNENYKEPSSNDVRGKLFLLTSGSTNESKIVQHSIENVLLNSWNCKNHLRLLASDRVIIPVPVYHMYGLGAAFIPSLLSGSSIFLIHKTNIIRYLSVETEFKPDIGFLAPTLSKMLVKLKRGKKNYRLVVSAGDKMDEKLFVEIESQLGKTINLYGSTELGVIATSDIDSELPDRKNGTLFSLDNVQLRFKDIQKEGSKKTDPKEIVCFHAFGFEKYIDKSGEMIINPTFIDNWFLTSDLCYVKDNNGCILIGRKNHSINRNGVLISYSEIEEKIIAVNERIEEVIILVSDEETRRGKKMVACCRGARLNHDDAMEIRLECINKLARHIVPDEIKIYDSFPLLPNGKINRTALQNLLK